VLVENLSLEPLQKKREKWWKKGGKKAVDENP